MYIANPMYDVVFKFMMEDLKVAKAFVSAIIREKVLELDFAPQEYTIHFKPKDPKEPEQEITVESGTGLYLTVCRFDFSAKIETPGGYKTVLIELQKAKFSTDIIRFRRYLGLNYINKDNTYDAEQTKARQLYCIFLLGYDIGIPDCPVISVDQKVCDMATSESIEASNEFISSLHHRSWIVQLSSLKEKRRNDLEVLLSLFDQDNRTLHHRSWIVQLSSLKEKRRNDLEVLLSLFDQDNRTQNHHILNIDIATFPEEYQHVLRRLRMAAESQQIQGEMEMEDYYVKDLRDSERLVNQQRQLIEEQGKALEEKDKVLEEKDKAMEEQAKALKEKAKVLEEKDKALEELQKQLAEIQAQRKN